jgi:hypothetical protein
MRLKLRDSDNRRARLYLRVQAVRAISCPPAEGPLSDTQKAEKQLDDIAASRTFVNIFSATGQPTMFTDVLGEPLLIGDSFFRTFTGEYKFKDATSGGGRRSYVIMLAEVLRRPDEIWEVQRRILATGKLITRRRYIGRYTIQGSNETMDALAVFEYDPVARQWFGNTIFPTNLTGASTDLEKQRRGVRLYAREP